MQTVVNFAKRLMNFLGLAHQEKDLKDNCEYCGAKEFITEFIGKHPVTICGSCRALPINSG